MSEPKALRIVIPWAGIGRFAFIVLSLVPVQVAYILAFPHWPDPAISNLTAATLWCAIACWCVAGGRIA